MTAAYKEPFEEPDATPQHRAGSSSATHGVENLIKNGIAKTKVPKKKAPTRPFRVLTANVRSDPEDALSLDDVLEDLQRNAAAGDLVFLQGIAPRYRPLVKQAFPRSEWEVFSGDDANREPIAFRKALFSMVTGQVSILHPARPGLHGRRLMTHLRLRFKPLSAEFHATNLHLVDGAFGKEDLPCQEGRRAAWATGLDKHRTFVDELVATGLPVVGGGAYNRPLKHHKALGKERAGLEVAYAVDKRSVDLLWHIDGRQTRWHLRSTDVFAGRCEKHPERNSDHGARQATLVLHPDQKPRPEPAEKRVVEDNRYLKHGPFELTRFGDTSPKVVDWKTRAALEEAERRLGYPLTVVQGSYNNGRVPASGPTHDGGGVVDLLAWDWKHKVRVLRSIGFAAWYRPKTSKWNPHIHAVLIDHGRLDPSAARQVAAYRRGRNGLTDDGPDTLWRPDPIPVFHYPPKVSGQGGGKQHTHPHPVPEHKQENPHLHGVPQHPHVQPPQDRPAAPPQRTLDGVDVSHHQRGPINIPHAQAAGLKFMYAKSTEGTTVVDETYRSKMRMARRAGIPFGSYHFARPDLGDAQQEALCFLRRADIRAGDMVPMLDLESTGGLSRAQLTAWVGGWVETVERELAKKGLVGKPIIYTRFDLDRGFGCKVWVARYNENGEPPRIPSPWKRAAVWQHSNGVVGPIKSVPGFGPVDVNALHPDIPLSALRLRSGTSSAGIRPKQRPSEAVTKAAAKAKRGNRPYPRVRSVDSKTLPER
jgi:GH25 family lysozyme M1 (1,4-beta-N-acetylmuramidase)